MNHIFPRPILTPLILSVLFGNVYFIFFAHRFDALYYILWLGGIGVFFLKYQDRIAARLAGWNVRQPAKFILLGYAAVFTEECIVALVHSHAEGFSLSGFTQFIFQFWSFNFFAFTGFIVGWYFLLSRFRYSAMDLFLIIGVWGLLSERTLTFLGTNTIAAILLILPNMSTYNLIIAPAIASMLKLGEKRISPWKKYPYSFLILFIFSIIPMLLLWLLRSQFPGAFPSCEYIPCT